MLGNSEKSHTQNPYRRHKGMKHFHLLIIDLNVLEIIILFWNLHTFTLSSLKKVILLFNVHRSKELKAHTLSKPGLKLNNKSFPVPAQIFFLL